MPGFWTKTEGGETIHINGDPNMSEADRLTITRMADAFAAKYDREQRAFDGQWHEENNPGIDRKRALYWFRLGVGWEEIEKDKRVKELKAEREAAVNAMANKIKMLEKWIDAAMPVLEGARDEAPVMERTIKPLLDAYLDL